MTAPPEEVIDALAEDFPGIAEPVRWSEYLPDGMLADLLAQPAQTDPEHGEFEALERIGGWERVIAWAQARQIREMTPGQLRAATRRAVLSADPAAAQKRAERARRERGVQVWPGSSLIHTSCNDLRERARSDPVGTCEQI